MLLLLSISFHEWTISRIYLSTCHHLTQRNLTPYPTQISHFPRHVDQQVSNLLDKERGRGREEKSFEPGLSKGSRGLVGGWQGCYDVLRCVVATKTMWLVTVIVRGNQPRPPSSFPFPASLADPFDPPWQAPLHSAPPRYNGTYESSIFARFFLNLSLTKIFITLRRF